jgi:hypothetical protein
MEFIDNSILSKCDSNNNTISKTASTTDNQIEDTSSQKIVQNNILISDTDTKV